MNGDDESEKKINQCLDLLVSFIVLSFEVYAQEGNPEFGFHLNLQTSAGEPRHP